METPPAGSVFPYYKVKSICRYLIQVKETEKRLLYCIPQPLRTKRLDFKPEHEIKDPLAGAQL
ncbi:MAG: hypothetical protein NDI77_12375 [Geobacteraceae bacterium]|nr:hypothetical protein [Geobacteraceae bacterium]